MTTDMADLLRLIVARRRERLAGLSANTSPAGGSEVRSILADAKSKKTMNTAAAEGKQLRSQDLDQFKFRIVFRSNGHYFKNVRFNTPNLSKEDAQRVILFFEGRNLEALASQEMEVNLQGVPLLPQLKALVLDLQTVICF